MKSYKPIVIILAIIGIFLVYFIVKSVKKTCDMLVAPREEAMIEEKQRLIIHAIPENRIPSVREIEKRITENKKRKVAENKAAAKSRKEEPQAPDVKEVAVPKLLPKKKEVKFPTYEERSERESRSGVVVY